MVTMLTHCSIIQSPAGVLVGGVHDGPVNVTLSLDMNVVNYCVHSHAHEIGEVLTQLAMGSEELPLPTHYKLHDTHH